MEVTKRTGEVSPSIHRHLQDFGYLQDLDADGFEVRELVGYIRSLRTVSTENSPQRPAASTSQKPESSAKPGLRASRYRRVVVSMWRWQEARRGEDVVRFRRDILNGDTIPLAELATSLERLVKEWGNRVGAAQADGRHAEAFQTWIGSEGGMARFFNDPTQMHPSVFSEFVRGHDPSLVPEKWMVDIARRLAEEFAWTVHEAIVMLLSDACPLLPAVRVRSQVRSLGNQKLILEVDPTASREEVVRAFENGRKEMIGHRHRPLSDKHLQLAFVTYPLAKRHAAGTRRKGVSKGSDLTWDKLLKRWNNQYPKWTYSTGSNFRRDALAAYEKLFWPRYQEVDDSSSELLETGEGTPDILDNLQNEA